MQNQIRQSIYKNSNRTFTSTNSFITPNLLNTNNKTEMDMKLRISTVVLMESFTCC